MISHRSRTLVQLTIALTAVAALAACVHLLAKPAAHYEFSHKLHAAELEQPCLKCHATIEGAIDLKVRNTPSQKVCQECHEQEIAGRDCGRCHQDTAALARAKRDEGVPRLDPMEHLDYSHADHLPRVNGDCLACHNQILTSTRFEEGLLPGMDTCMTCHEEMYDQLQCSQCHVDLGDPRYQPSISRFTHKGDWLANHHLHAEQRGYSTCQQCHLESFCSDCHSAVDNQVKLSTKWPRRVDRQFIHRGDYLSRHPIDARRDSQSCLGCHRINTCKDCHDKSGVRVVQSGLDVFGGHPIVSVTSGGHATDPASLSEIRRSIVECAGCHEGSSPTCLRCHAETTLRINPHPPGFESQFGRTERAVCRQCHRR